MRIDKQRMLLIKYVSVTIEDLYLKVGIGIYIDKLAKNNIILILTIIF